MREAGARREGGEERRHAQTTAPACPSAGQVGARCERREKEKRREEREKERRREAEGEEEAEERRERAVASNPGRR